MTTSKLFFHTGQPCNSCGGLKEMWDRLEAAGISFGVYSADNGGLAGLDAVRYKHAEHIIYRDLTYDYVPYHVVPTPEKGQELWAAMQADLPPEVTINRSRVWIEVFNEPDVEKPEAVADWQYHLAMAAMAQGFKFCGPAWSAGTPEPSAWVGPKMQRYLRLCAQFPDRVALTLHEYSLSAVSAKDNSPWHIGRFQDVNAICDSAKIGRPTVFITEWGWTLDDMPLVETAVEDWAWAAELYASAPNVKAAFAWTLMGGGDKVRLGQRLQSLISWVTDYTLKTRFKEEGPVTEKHTVVVLKLPQELDENDWAVAARYAYQFRHTMTASHDDMLTLLAAGNERSYVKLAWPKKQPDVENLLKERGIRWEPVFAGAVEPPPFSFTAYPVLGPVGVTQEFGKRPEVYAQYGFPGHEGIDLRAALAAPIVSVADGVVDKITDTASTGYGKAVHITHSQGWRTTYGHLSRVADIKEGDNVKGGQIIGFAGSTGNSTGSHLHLTLKRAGFTYKDAAGTTWPFNIFDPTPFLEPFIAAGQSPTVDLLDYFRGTHRRQFDMGYMGGTQSVQVWHLGPQDWLYVKGEQGEYEHLGLRTWNGQEWIYRFEDTSESPDRFYAHYPMKDGPIGAPWFPRFAEVGKTYSTAKYVQHYLKSGCVPQNGGQVTDRLKLVGLPRAASYLQSHAGLNDVITLEWSGGEQYDFAKGRGCVAFRDSTRTFWFIGDLEGRADKQFKKPTCLNLGW